MEDKSLVAQNFYQHLYDKGYKIDLCHFSNPMKALDSSDPIDKIMTYPFIMFDMPKQSKSKNPSVKISCYRTSKECQASFNLTKDSNYFIRIFDNRANVDISGNISKKTNIKPPF